MTRKARVILKTGVWIVCLLPLLFLLSWTVTGDLTANPISFITNHLGQWTFRLLLASLAMTPLRILFGMSWPVTLRRLL
ncbi:MAG: sulfoxide reductase heme-binding subunit YedZ, partial [candidate division NC10 bacterium]